MFESLTKRFEKKEKPSFDDKKFQVEVVVKFKKFYTVKAYTEEEAGARAANKMKKYNKTYLDKGLHFLEATTVKVERIKDD
tara:strand:+ start:1338 stop:1580 length:243 start_codon:yes stop_codon:yes gene_type:complete